MRSNKNKEVKYEKKFFKNYFRIIAAASLSAYAAQKADTETLSELGVTTAYETPSGETLFEGVVQSFN